MNVHGQSLTDTSITYIHNKPASFKSQFLQLLMGIIGVKNRIEKKLNSKETRSVPAELPKSLQDKFMVQVDEINQRRVWTIKPKQNASQNVILYIHGGGYISNLTKYDWRLIEALLSKTNSMIVVPDYPLAPESDYEDLYDYFDCLYSSLMSKVADKKIIFMGNSAGGGIALGFAQKLRNENRTQPSQLILISPWLDITLSNPDIGMVDNKDKLLSVKGLRMAAQVYGSSVNGKDFRVSPIYGNFSGLGKISLFIGTHELFIADARKLKNLLNNADIPYNYFEYPKMFHVWVAVTDLKESQHAIEQIAILIDAETEKK
jgi:acetyl esterase/lipase